MEEIADTVYETPENRSGRYAYGALVDLCRSREVPVPSYMTFMRYLKTRDDDRQIARRRGPEGSRSAGTGVRTAGPVRARTGADGRGSH